MRDWPPQPQWRRECDHDCSWILQLIAPIAFVTLDVRDFSCAASGFGQVSSPRVTLAEEPKHSAARKKPLAPRVRLCLLKNRKWTWQITRSCHHVTNLAKYDPMLSAFRNKYWHEKIILPIVKLAYSTPSPTPTNLSVFRWKWTSPNGKLSERGTKCREDRLM